MGELRKSLIAAAPKEHRDGLELQQDLDERVRTGVSAGLAAHPEFALTPNDLAAHVGARLQGPTLEDGLHWEDLALALGCLSGDERATTKFQRLFAPEIERGLAKLRGTDTLEAAQDVLTRMLVTQNGRPPKLASYRGQGQLLHWIRVTIVRMRIDLARRDARTTTPTAIEVEHVVEPEGDPEYSYFKEHYGVLLKQSFQEALAALAPKQRSVLRQHLIDALSHRQIASVHNVDHKTIGRWLERSRQQIWENVRERLTRELGLPPSELQSIIKMIRSQIDLSISRVL